MRRRTFTRSSRHRRSASARSRPREFEPRNEWLEAFIAKLEPPPFPGTIDVELAAAAPGDLRRACAGCHAEGGARAGTAIPLAEIGTDPEHVAGVAAAERRSDEQRRAPARRAQRRCTGSAGWLRRPAAGRGLAAGPYLHNGSVPTCRTLLSPPAQRPEVFYRGYDVVDLGESRLRLDRTAKPPPKVSASTRRARQQQWQGIYTAPNSTKPTSAPCSNT